MKKETNPERLEMASMLLKKVTISLTERRPKGMNAWQADAAQREAEELVARIGALRDKFRAAMARREAAS